MSKLPKDSPTDEVVELHADLSADLAAITTPRTGWIVGLNEQGRVLVDYPGNPYGPLRARSTIVQTQPELERAAETRCPALLLFEEGDPGRPIMVGLLQDSVPVQPAEAQPMQIEADGKRVEVEAADELVLRCGKASLVLRRNGRVIIRGTYVETRSSGVNRIKGGSVQIN